MSREYFNDTVTISEEARRLYNESKGEVNPHSYNIEEVKPKKENLLGLYFFLICFAGLVGASFYVVTSVVVEALRKIMI